MTNPLEPKPGFDWTKVRWTGPFAPVDETCSYCGETIDEESVPLRLWNAESWAAVFCEGCMQTWWGFQSMTEDGSDNPDPYIGSASDLAPIDSEDDGPADEDEH
jgi:hypothetical protein